MPQQLSKRPGDPYTTLWPGEAHTGADEVVQRRPASVACGQMAHERFLASYWCERDLDRKLADCAGNWVKRPEKLCVDGPPPCKMLYKTGTWPPHASHIGSFRGPTVSPDVMTPTWRNEVNRRLHAPHVQDNLRALRLV